MRKLSSDELLRPSLETYGARQKIPVCIVLDHVRSLHNVGAAFRTADAFSIEKIYLSGITGRPPHRDIQKTALGATESVPWQYISRAADVAVALKQDGYRIVAVEQTSESVPLQRFTPRPDTKYALVFGNEVEGVSDEVLALCQQAIVVPQSGIKHSLNISVCLGIVVWDFYRKIRVTCDA